MKQVLMGALVVLLFAIAGITSVAATRPADFTISRSRVIEGTPAELFGPVGDLKRWKEWSPWAEIDPGMKIEYREPTNAPGGAQTWSGEKSGSGTLTFVELVPGKKVAYEIEFNGWNTKNQGEVSVEPVSQKNPVTSQVTWTMRGRNSFKARVFWLAFGFERAIQKDFDRGLELLEQRIRRKKAMEATVRSRA